MDTDALLRALLMAWIPGRYDVISTAEHDALGGGTDWEQSQLSQAPAWLRQSYPDLVGESDAQLLARLTDRLMLVGADRGVVTRIVNFFDGRQADGTAYSGGRPQAILWDPGTRLAQQVEATHMLDRVFDKVADDLDRAVQRSPNAPTSERRPGLITKSDIPNFSGGFLMFINLFSSVRPLMGPLGGTQKLFAVVGDYRTFGQTNDREYEYDLHLVVGDDFGVDEQDVTKHGGAWYADGLAAMWTLQRMRGRRPFINFVVLKRKVRGRVGAAHAHRFVR